jgi:hypothetical protein
MADLIFPISGSHVCHGDMKRDKVLVSTESKLGTAASKKTELLRLSIPFGLLQLVTIFAPSRAEVDVRPPPAAVP